MHQFMGKYCPVCNAPFSANDDVVVCSNCGVPHHRACWLQQKSCSTPGCTGRLTNLATAISGSGVLGNVQAVQPTVEKRFCPACGTPCKPGASFCARCGKPLAAKVAPAPAAPVPEEPKPQIDPNAPLYNKATELLEAAESRESLEKAARFFGNLGSYRNSPDLRSLCLEKINEIDYTKAKEAQERAKTVVDFQKAEAMYLALGDFRDSAHLALVCKDSVRELQNEVAYRAAVEKMDRALKSHQLEVACTLFGNLKDYKDSREKLVACKKKLEDMLEDERKNELYAQIMKDYESDDLEVLTAAKEQLESIHPWKESKEKLVLFQEKIDRVIEQQKKERLRHRKRRNRILIVLSTLAVLIAAGVVLTLTLFIPMHQSGEADEYLRKKNYHEAMRIYSEYSDFEDNELQIKMIRSLQLLESNQIPEGIRASLAAGVPVQVKYVMEGGDFNGGKHLQVNPDSTATLSTAGDKLPTQVDITYNTSADFENLKIPGRNGYHFQGWYFRSNNYIFGEEKNLLEVTVVARWEPKEYAMTYDLDGGSLIGENPERYSPVDDLITLTNPTKEGYTFAGWIGTELSEPTLEVTLPTGSYGHRTYTATWKPNAYQITLIPNNGDVTSVENVVYGEEYRLPTPSKPGYDFEGWYSGTTKIPNTGVWNNPSNLTLSAVWAGKAYTLVLQDTAKIGFHYSYSPGRSVNFNVVYNANYSLPNLTRTGYIFLGWKTSGGSYVASNGRWTGWRGDTLTPAWQAESYTVTLMNGGTQYDTVSVNYNGTLTLPTPTPVAGKTFLGWYDDATGALYTSGTTWMIDSNKTLTARWTPYTLTISNVTQTTGVQVTFSDNWSGGSSYTVSVPAGQTLSYPAIPTRNGYVFAGWYTNSSCTNKYSFAGTLASNRTLYAKWIAQNYPATLLNVGSTASVSISDVTPRYYAFVPLTSGAITVYTSNSSSSDIDPVGFLYSATMTQLAFNDDGNGNGQFRYTYNVTAGTLYYIEVRGYGYGSNGTVTLHLTGPGTPVSTATVSSSASGRIWTYSADPDDCISENVEHGTTITLFTPTRPGYTFDGWYIGDTRVTASTITIKQDTVLTPRWR